MTSLTYLTMDEIGHGVGASQVLPYIEQLATRGVEIRLHSFEQHPPTAELKERLKHAGVIWHRHRFRPGGPPAGLARVLHGAAMVRGASVVHARSDLAAAAALLARSRVWVWDVRSFWADQRIAMGSLRRGSSEERVLRGVERAAAARATMVTTLTAAAIDVLAERHGDGIRARATVIPTCVDLDRFSLAPMPDRDLLQLVLSGSFNALYDPALTFRFIEAVKRLRQTALTLLRPRESPWDARVIEAGGSLASVSFTKMPHKLRESHAGLSICRTDDRAAIAGAAPTKIAEFLATGRPVVVNAGLGDMDNLLTRYQCGVVLTDCSREGIDDAAQRLGALIDDDQLSSRCRAAARDHFDLEQGVTKLLQLYHVAQQ